MKWHAYRPQWDNKSNMLVGFGSFHIRMPWGVTKNMDRYYQWNRQRLLELLEKEQDPCAQTMIAKTLRAITAESRNTSVGDSMSNGISIVFAPLLEPGSR